MEVPSRIYIPSTPIIVCVNTDNIQNFPAVNAHNLNVPGGTCLSHNRVDRLNNLCVVTSTLQPQTSVSSAYVVPNHRRVVLLRWYTCKCAVVACRVELIPCVAVGEAKFESAVFVKTEVVVDELANGCGPAASEYRRWVCTVILEVAGTKGR